MIGKVSQKHPQVKIVATPLREVHSTNCHSWGAVAWIAGKTVQAPTCELDVVDRAGGGDVFPARFIYGLVGGESAEEAIKTGWVRGELVTTGPGVTTLATAQLARA